MYHRVTGRSGQSGFRVSGLELYTEAPLQRRVILAAEALRLKPEGLARRSSAGERRCTLKALSPQLNAAALNTVVAPQAAQKNAKVAFHSPCSRVPCCELHASGGDTQTACSSSRNNSRRQHLYPAASLAAGDCCATRLHRLALLAFRLPCMQCG